MSSQVGSNEASVTEPVAEAVGAVAGTEANSNTNENTNSTVNTGSTGNNMTRVYHSRSVIGGRRGFRTASRSAAPQPTEAVSQPTPVAETPVVEQHEAPAAEASVAQPSPVSETATAQPGPVSETATAQPAPMEEKTEQPAPTDEQFTVVPVSETPAAQPAPEAEATMTQPTYEQPMAVQPAAVQPAPTPIPQQPVYEQPVAIQPAPTPIPQQPVYEQPVAVQPAPTPIPQQPIYEQPQAVQPAPAPIPQQPVYSPIPQQPVYEQPGAVQPAYSPILQQPAYEQPQAVQPAYTPIPQQSVYEQQQAVQPPYAPMSQQPMAQQPTPASYGMPNTAQVQQPAAPAASGSTVTGLEQQLDEMYENLRLDMEDMEQSFNANIVSKIDEAAGQTAAMMASIEDIRTKLETPASADDEVKKSLDEINKKIGDQGDVDLKESFEEINKALTTAKNEITDSVHSENVKVYRNIQDLFKEDKSGEELELSLEVWYRILKKRLSITMTIMIINMGLAVILILAILGVF